MNFPRLCTRDPGCTCSPMLCRMKMPTSCLLNSTLEGKHFEGARKEQSSVGGIETCLTSISGDTYVSNLEIVIVED